MFCWRQSLLDNNVKKELTGINCEPMSINAGCTVAQPVRLFSVPLSFPIIVKLITRWAHRIIKADLIYGSPALKSIPFELSDRVITYSFWKNYIKIPDMAQQLMNPTNIHETRVQFQALLCGLSIWCCHELCADQMACGCGVGRQLQLQLNP